METIPAERLAEDLRREAAARATVLSSFYVCHCICGSPASIIHDDFTSYTCGSVWRSLDDYEQTEECKARSGGRD